MSPAKLLTLLIILPLALILDAVGIVLICFGLDDFFITDIIGLVFITGWFYGLSSFGGTPTEVELPPLQRKPGLRQAVQKTTKTLKWAKRLRWLRFLLFFCELIPYVGAFFWWTILVIIELKNSSSVK